MGVLNPALVYLLLYTMVAIVAGASSKPNIVLIVADDYGWNDVGYHGSQIKTPHIDRLAFEGVRLENHYAQSMCTPSRAQLLSGRYVIHTHLQHGIIQIAQPNALPKENPTIADIVKRAGYATHAVGKWHIGFWKDEYTPTHRGFDSFYGYYGAKGDQYHARGCQKLPKGPKKEKSTDCGTDLHDNDKVVYNITEYSTNLFTRKAQEIVKSHNSDQPLFLYLAYQAVHHKLQVPDYYSEPYNWIEDKSRRIYAGMVNALDEGVGNLTETLKEKGIYKNTVIIFISDNGGQLTKGGNNWPLRGGKLTLWEGGIRCIGFVHSTLLKNKGTQSHDLFDISDWFPTIAGLAGAPLDGTNLDGYDIWKTISEGAENPRKEILHNIDPLMKHGKSLYPDVFNTRVRSAIRVGDWKLITGKPDPKVNFSGWIAPPENPHLHSEKPDRPKDKNLWLFNIRLDPTEREDLSTRHPDLVRTMLERLAFYDSTAVPVYYPPIDPRCDPTLHGDAWVPWG